MDQNVKSSPTPEKGKTEKPNKETYNFLDALWKLHLGYKVRSLSWIDPEYWFQMIDGYLCIHEPDGEFHPLKVRQVDFERDDYVIVQ